MVNINEGLQPIPAVNLRPTNHNQEKPKTLLSQCAVSQQDTGPLNTRKKQKEEKEGMPNLLQKDTVFYIGAGEI